MALRKLSLVRGDSHTYTLTFKNSSGGLYCLKNWAVHFTLKSRFDLPDSVASLQKIVTAFADSTSGTSGVAEVALEPVDTINLEPGKYVYDIAVTTNEGKIYTVMRGDFDLEWDVTRTSGTAGSA